MEQTISKYASMLAKLQIPMDAVVHTSEIFSAVPQVKETLADPCIASEKKHNIIEKVFPEKIRDILKLLCDNQEIECWDHIVEQLPKEMPEEKGVLDAVLTYVTAPKEEQLEGIREFLKKMSDKSPEQIREERYERFRKF